jgi:hypothetical protein
LSSAFANGIGSCALIHQNSAERRSGKRLRHRSGSKAKRDPGRKRFAKRLAMSGSDRDAELRFD